MTETAEDSPARQHWHKAIESIKELESDPWSLERIEELPAERVLRHRFVVTGIHADGKTLPAPDLTLSPDLSHHGGAAAVPPPPEASPATVASRRRISVLSTQDLVHTTEGTWSNDYAIVKVQQREPFNAGAMRECFRLKKLTQQPNRGYHVLDWKHASNYVAKLYKDHSVGREAYLADVQLQMEAAYWAQLYDSYDPPKRILMIQAYAIEFVDRPEKPLMCIERFMDGEYIKHNSNCGFVDPNYRMTPQAFSHFSFHKSGGKVMVVDIQGIGDMYTDPQIHSVEKRFGSGDLGVKGMALFFASHTCNPICALLGLVRFDLYSTEIQRLFQVAQDSPQQTLAAFPLKDGRAAAAASDATDPLSGTSSGGSGGSGSSRASKQGACSSSSRGPVSSSAESEADLQGNGTAPCDVTTTSRPLQRTFSNDVANGAARRPPRPPTTAAAATAAAAAAAASQEPPLFKKKEQQQFTRSSFFSAVPLGDTFGISSLREAVEELAEVDEITPAADIRAYFKRSSSGYVCEIGEAGCGAEEERLKMMAHVHLELARLHLEGRIQPGGPIDAEAAVYHLYRAAKGGDDTALTALARYHSGLSSGDPLFPDQVRKLIPEEPSLAPEIWAAAAAAGSAEALSRVALAAQRGEGVAADDKDNELAWDVAALYYQQCLQQLEEGKCSEDALCLPPFEVMAALGEMLAAGGHGLEADAAAAKEWYGKAAEAAMEAMQMKRANRYLMMADEL